MRIDRWYGSISAVQMSDGWKRCWGLEQPSPIRVASLPAISTKPHQEGRARTSKEETLCRLKESVLGFCCCDGIESPNTHDFPDSVSTSIICVGVCAQNTAEVCLQPQLIRSYSFVSSFVYAVTIDSTRYRNVDAHVET
jgi:hypothetical protein